MRDPPERTTVKAPLLLAKCSDKSAVYLARETAKSSPESKTLLSDAMSVREARGRWFLGVCNRESPEKIGGKLSEKAGGLNVTDRE